MNKQDLHKPSECCFLTVDKNGFQLKEGHILQSSGILPLRSNEEKSEKYQPIEKENGRLIVRHYGSFLVRSFVESHCIVSNPEL